MTHARRVLLSLSLISSYCLAVLNGGSCSASTGLTCPEENPCCSGK